jgi:hypothetical protein
MLTRNPSRKPWFGLWDRLGNYLSCNSVPHNSCWSLISLSKGIQWSQPLTLLPFHWMTPAYLSFDPMILYLPDPMVAISPKLKRNDHDPLNPHRGSMTFCLLCIFCNAIPPNIFNFPVRIRSRTRDSDQQTQSIPAQCFNQKL